MENGCPVLPKKTKNSERVQVLEDLTQRAEVVMKKLAEIDPEKANSFMKNFEYLKENGDPMIEWFVSSREMNQPEERKNQTEPDSDHYYSF